MVLVQKSPFFSTFSFQAIQDRKVSFTIFQSEKTPFQAIKTRSSNSRKIDIFPQGLTHGFGQKMAILPSFFFQAIQARKMYFTIFYIDKTPFQPIKRRSSKIKKLPFQAITTRRYKSRKIDIFPKGLTYSFGRKMAIFRTFSFQAKQARKMSFTIFQSEKTSFRAIKTRR